MVNDKHAKRCDFENESDFIMEYWLSLYINNLVCPSKHEVVAFSMWRWPVNLQAKVTMHKHYNAQRKHDDCGSCKVGHCSMLNCLRAAHKEFDDSK